MTGWFAPKSDTPAHRIAICGSRATGTNSQIIDEAIKALAQLLMRCRWQVIHGPIGVGIEVMTFIADHYRPPTLRAAVGRFGRQNVVRDVDYVLIVGGGQGTQDEADLAFSMEKKVIPMPASGGTAQRVYAVMERDIGLRCWTAEEDFAALGGCTDPSEYARIVERMLAADRSHA